jgi:hypothetical protein
VRGLRAARSRLVRAAAERLMATACCTRRGWRRSGDRVRSSLILPELRCDAQTG